MDKRRGYFSIVSAVLGMKECEDVSRTMDKYHSEEHIQEIRVLVLEVYATYRHRVRGHSHVLLLGASRPGLRVPAFGSR